ncbi:MAG TPA: type II secretion system protein [Burkholderiaceae bacterium]|nr:type II secretion system protein [Burkholderiaceae bacterium]
MKRAAAQRGLTLMETLVTLVIVSLVAGLVAEGLYQIARAERGLEGVQLQSRLSSLHERWVIDALEGLVVRSAEERDRFAGDGQVLTGTSTLLPVPSDTGAEHFVLRLKPMGAADGTALVLELPARKLAVELMRWTMSDLAWAFVDDAGHAQSQWPPEPLWRGQSLPRTIELRGKDGQRALLLASPAHNALVPAKRSAAEEKL